ncbi:MAG: sigma-70 family RNA polymerase sigma factor [Opitutaceae bacterium]|nr:sigma-70 family RNA polymerase sigma factor [Opitutaceae bacterium]
MPPPDSEQTRWFHTHLLPHEPMLRAWLQSRFPRIEPDDILQDAYVRVLQAHEKGPMQSPKAFLYAVARNLALDQVRRRHVAGENDPARVDELNLLDETIDVSETVARNQELEILTQAIQTLPDRCRRIFTLRKVYGMSQSDIARQLGLSEHTVSAQLTIGLHKCTDYMRRCRQERDQ